MKVKLGILFIFSILMISGILALDESHYYKFKMDYRGGQIDIKEVNVEFIYREIVNFNSDNSYYLEVVDRGGNVLSKTFFSVPLNFITESGNETGDIIESSEETFNEVNFELAILYLDNGHKAIVYDNLGVKLDEKLISQYSTNGFDIDEFEEFKEVDEIISEKDEENIFSESKDINYFQYIIGLLVLLVALVIVLIVSLKRKT